MNSRQIALLVEAQCLQNAHTGEDRFKHFGRFLNNMWIAGAGFFGLNAVEFSHLVDVVIDILHGEIILNERIATYGRFEKLTENAFNTLISSDYAFTSRAYSIFLEYLAMDV